MDNLSFAVNPPGAVQQQAPASGSATAAAGGNVSGGSVSGGATGEDRSVAILMDLGSKLLGPKIQAAKQEQFMQGVQKAQTGQALTEIIDQRPWYTEVFGPSAASQGARAYTTQVAIAGWAAEMETKMPKLAEQGPEAIQQMATGALKGFMTGDAQADALITSAAVEQFAPLFKRHAKEHYAFTQNKASEAQLGAWTQLARVHQAQASDPKATPEDKQAAADRFLGTLSPFGDQSEASYNQNIGKLLSNSVVNGDFQTIRMFQNTKPDGKTSLWEQVPYDTRIQLERAMPAAARKHLDTLMPKYGLEVAMIVNDTAQDPRKVGARIAAFNEKVRQETGIHEADMIAPGTADNITGRVLNAQAAEAARLAGKEEDNRPAVAASLVGTGALGKSKTLGIVRETDVENAMYGAWVKTTDPLARAALLNKEGDLKADAIRADLRMPLASEDFNSGVKSTATIYASLDEPVKASYFDEKQRARLDRFNVNVRSGMPEVSAWQVSGLMTPEETRSAIPEQERTVIQKEVRKRAEKNNEGFFGGNTVSDASLRTIESLMMKSYRADSLNNPPEVAAARAYQQALNNGLSIVGNHAVLSPIKGGNVQPLYALVKEGMGATNEAFDGLMQERAKAQGATLDNYIVTRAPDRDGKAYFQVLATGDDGHTKAWTIGSDDVKARITSGIKADVQRASDPNFKTDMRKAAAGLSLF